jgi:hypothetical protein
MKQFFAFLMFVAVSTVSIAQNIQNNPTSNHGNKFEQLGTILSTPNAVSYTHLRAHETLS